MLLSITSEHSNCKYMGGSWIFILQHSSIHLSTKASQLPWDNMSSYFVSNSASSLRNWKEFYFIYEIIFKEINSQQHEFSDIQTYLFGV
jgi:hypothetical protein